MATPNKPSKSSSEVSATHVYIIVGLLVVIAVILIYAVTNGAFAANKFH